MEEKKKGQGAKKTTAKTEKKALQKLKKELAANGEDDIETLIAQFVEEDRKKLQITEELVGPPSCRSGATLCAHPEKDELLLFGGEYYNGKKTIMYNELFVYNIKKNNWLLVKGPNFPPPRCAHQAVMAPQGGGQMWIFGGEYASPTKSQFHHYKDLWVYYIASQSWEQVRAPGGPSARSGHRMVLVNRQLLLFGGFHESFRDYRYFNDVYLFRLDLRTWTKLEFSNSGPSPRSGCQLLPVGEAKALVYGGYSREKTKSEFDQGKAFGDMYLLQCDPENSGKYQEMEETLVGHFFNDLFCLDMDKGFWQSVTLKGDKGIVQLGDSSAQEEGPHEGLHKLHIEEPVVTSDDGVFTVTIGASKHKAPVEPMHHEPTTSKERKDTFAPVSRMGSCMAIKHGVLYLYGGVFEDEDRQFTLSDMYALDLRKLDEWKVLVPLAPEAHEWLGSDDSDLESEESDVEDEDDEDSEKGACASRNSKKIKFFVFYVSYT
ncbi:hypothetical protein MRX96_002027 [Rhipicephalus microplus]